MECRVPELEPGPLLVNYWPATPRGHTDLPLMLVLIRRGVGALTTMGRVQMDGNQPPRFRCSDDGITYDVTYADPGVGECPACHGVSRTHRHTHPA